MGGVSKGGRDKEQVDQRPGAEEHALELRD